ncbi:MAG: protease inhibitor I42 family protein [Flavobacteriales bacterium]
MKKILFSLLVISIALSSCNRDCYQADEVKSSYEIEKGKEFEVSFNSQSGTGYSWVWTNESNNQHLKLKDNDNHACSATTGGNSVESFTIEGTAVGNDSVVMKYAQSWDSTSMAEKKVIYVTVK